MYSLVRSPENPLILPNSQSSWEDLAAFNGSPIKQGRNIHMFYRALAHPELHSGALLPLSTIGHALSRDGIHFSGYEQFIVPEEIWERYGCEDPRVTKLDGRYYIFYTALATYPFSADGITIGLAISDNLKSVSSKHHVTNFNSKAMTLFPERINGKIMALLSVNTDRPPATIALASFEKEEDMWSPDYWNNWHSSLKSHSLNLGKQKNDHVEIGAAPLKTKEGWLLIYCHIYNYGKPDQIFGIEAVLLDLNDPQKIIGRTPTPLMTPQEEYEYYGMIPNVIFPSGAYLEKDDLHIYYGAADTTVCRATVKLSKLIREMMAPESDLRFERTSENPILSPLPEHDWENTAVFNPAALFENDKIHIIYRAMGKDGTSRFGYAISQDGIHINERLIEPIYGPRESFEQKTKPGNSGCEDARFTKLGETYYVCYTAFDGINPPRVALTSILVTDFLERRFEKFTKPILISAPKIDDKDAALFPEKINGQYVFIHRVQPSIHLNYVKSLSDFDGEHFFISHPIIKPRINMWDDLKIGLSSTPIKTNKGWLLIYHGVSSEDHAYRVGAALLNLKNPEKVIGRTRSPLLEPEMPYEKNGIVPNVVFPCGAVVMGEKLLIYYGAADKVIGMASLELPKLLKDLVG
jgi:beta-1,2-mannobiose phosphorylase / 1,2-beta-oligomannan phosphorylase